MILIRHGESEFNAVFNRTRIDPGIKDPKLTDRGRAQVREAADALRRHEVPIRRILTSPYTRALETAAILAEALGLSVEVEPIVHEHACWTCDIGTPISLLTERWPALDFAHLAEIWWPEAEPEENLHRRCADFRVKAARRADWRHLAVVSHWGFIKRLTGHDARNAELVPFDPTRA
ncbi:MAG TPA: histidine phosphatase family protein [Candidatus Cybelea sp.]|nr:histidine phosphatase family protein [Candidatus Cybelea sp.]